MEKAQWAHDYARMCRAFGREADPEQASVYFDVVRDKSGHAISGGVSVAIRECKRFPTVADILERAAQIRTLQPESNAPKCETCQGSSWTQHPCDGVTASKNGPVVTDRARFCGVGDCPHQWHAYAKRCHCFPFQQQQGAA